MKKQILQLCALSLVALSMISLKTYSQSWKLIGNAGTNPATNFLGTTDAQPLIFRTSGDERMRILSSGKVGIGIKTPTAKLHVIGKDNVSLSSPGYVMLGNVAKYNMAMDINTIQARYNGGPATLNLNYYGGSVYAGNYTTSPYGLVGNGSTAGVYGATYDSSGIGVYGWSAYYHGVYGYTGGGFTGSDPNFPAAIHGYNSGYGNGVMGYCVSGTGTVGWSDEYVGVWGHTGNSGSWAGYFAGNVYSTGTYQGSDEKLKQNIKE